MLSSTHFFDITEDATEHTDDKIMRISPIAKLMLEPVKLIAIIPRKPTIPPISLFLLNLSSLTIRKAKQI